MNIALFAINRPLYTWIIMLICALGGIFGFFNLGRLEDPAFTIKTATVLTEYPGASAETVAREVSEPLESTIQKMSEVEQIRSRNQPGLSLISVDMKDHYDGTELPDLWTKLRTRVAQASLPEGAGAATVDDGFGDVFGIYYAISAVGFSDREIYQLSAFLRREILTIDGVADVVLSGVPNEVIYIEPRLEIVANLGISPATLVRAIANANTVNAAGLLEEDTRRTLIQAPLDQESLKEITGLKVGVGGKVVSLQDFAHVTRGRENDPSIMIRQNGREAFTLAVAGIASENIVDVGKRVDSKLADLRNRVPLGVEIEPIYQQHVIVERDSLDFLTNLALSVCIVVIVLALFMGIRAAGAVGITLVLTVVGTVLFMWLLSIEMERISLGALIIAMGMLVDNSIVMAEGMQVAMLRGKSSREAAHETASKTQIPLLGATAIAIMAFAGIGLSNDATGEFLFSLFAVIAISLLLSWGLALTVTPLLGHYLFRQGTLTAGGGYDGLIFRAYRVLLGACLKAWVLVLLGLVGLTIVSVFVFGQVTQQFFPSSNTPLTFVHYQLVQGTSIRETSKDIAVLENWLAEQPEIDGFTAFVGQGANRFLLTYQPEDSNPSYGHIIIRTRTIDVIPSLIDRLVDFAEAALPQGDLRVQRLSFGPGGGNPIQVRFSGPDPEVLRDLADDARVRMRDASSDILSMSVDWREREHVLRPIYATDRAQQAGISRQAVAQATQFATTGINAGLLRENERQLPIIVRSPPGHVALADQLIWSDVANAALPFDQVTDGLIFEAQDTLMMRRDRVFTITVNAEIAPEQTAAQVHSDIQVSIETMTLPVGYKMEWGGEAESSADAQEALGASLPITVVIMALISVLLFNAVRQPVIVWLLVPMSLIGVSFALYGTGLPFTFTALLGLLSLTGMLIKNGIVLVEEIDITRLRSSDVRLSHAIIEASVSRCRPVLLAAITTILGMTPLIWDAFFRSMAVAIMGGLAFASILTLVAAPILYFVFFGRDRIAQTS